MLERNSPRWKLGGRGRQRARLHLGQIQHVVDQHQQVLAAAPDGVNALALLLGQIRVEAEQLGVAEDAVERRAQLVAHVGQERVARAPRGLGRAHGLLGQLLGLAQLLEHLLEGSNVAARAQDRAGLEIAGDAPRDPLVLAVARDVAVLVLHGRAAVDEREAHLDRAIEVVGVDELIEALLLELVLAPAQDLAERWVDRVVVRTAAPDALDLRREIEEAGQQDLALALARQAGRASAHARLSGHPGEAPRQPAGSAVPGLHLGLGASGPDPASHRRERQRHAGAAVGVQEIGQRTAAQLVVGEAQHGRETGADRDHGVGVVEHTEDLVRARERWIQVSIVRHAHLARRAALLHTARSA